MFLDFFPMHEQDIRPTRPVREPAVETAKSRSAWPFIVNGKGDSISDLRAAPESAFAGPDTSSFVT